MSFGVLGACSPESRELDEREAESSLQERDFISPCISGNSSNHSKFSFKRGLSAKPSGLKKVIQRML